MIFAPLLFLASLPISAFPNPIIVNPAATADTGSFQVYLKDRAIGGETFRYETRGDSAIVFSRVEQYYPSAAGTDTVMKYMTLLAHSFDYDLRYYESLLTVHGHTLQRVLALEDTLLSSYRQMDEMGVDDKLVRPPGKLYIMDAQIFTLYDVLCRNLKGKTFVTRPVSLYTLGEKDSLSMATATDLGTETVRWGTRQVRARKISISDPDMEFYVWIAPDGHMLRLEQHAYELRVDRVPPAAPTKARAPRAKKPS